MFFFSKCAVNVNKFASSNNVPPNICICINFRYKYKYIFGFFAMEVLNNIVIFKTLTFNYGKTVLSEENLMTPSCFGDHCSPVYVKSYKIN